MATQDDSEYVSLASRIDELSRICVRLSQENAELRDRMSRLTATESQSIPAMSASAGRDQREERAAQPQDSKPPNDKLSRRRLGKALAASAAGVVGAAALADATARPAAASDGTSITAGNSTTAESATVVTFDGSSSPGMVFLANDTNFAATGPSFPAALGGWAGNTVAHGVYGYTDASGGHAVVGLHHSASGTGAGVAGFSNSTAGDAVGVVGAITSTSPGGFSAGVRGINNSTGGLGIGVWGSQAGSGWGVYATSASGIGVVASGSVGVSASGTTTGVAATGPTAVSAQGTKFGVDATGTTAVHAIGTSTGASVHGPTGVHGGGTGAAGVGVRGSGSGSGGRGGIFNGSAAQLKLNPGSRSTHPVSGQRGDLYADSTGRLWYCKSGGTHAVWHQIA